MPESELQYPYQDASLPADTRAADLLSRMSIEEKMAQMMGVWNEKADKLVDEHGSFSAEKARQAFGDGHGLGQVGRPSDAGAGLGAADQARLCNAIQRYFVENTRLGIPVIFHEECLHGQAGPEGTSFPQPIGLAATFDPDLVEALYGMTAHEARARGAQQALTPVVDVARDPRWGRVEETFGEDPFLVATLGAAAVRGFQGDGSLTDGRHVIATLKHFAAHGQPEGGMNCAPVNVSERELRDVFLEPFRHAIQAAGAVSVMASYNEIDGVPSHASTWLLRDVLRGEWGFEGFVVSDYYAIWELNHRPDTHGHAVAASKAEAAALAVRAGVNIELPEPDCYLELGNLIGDGRLAESDLDSLVAPLLYWKFRMGLFENPYVDPDEAHQVVRRPEHRELALRAARETITLLQNRGDLLPLDPASVRRVAVIGPNAAEAKLGGYSGDPLHRVSILDGIRERLGDSVEVEYALGCAITEGGSWNEDDVTPGDPTLNLKRIAEAIEVARRADVVILAIGGNEQTSREAWALNHQGDRTDLGLFGDQDALIEALAGTGKPVVGLLVNGRPLDLRVACNHVPALLECWYLGQEGGTAVAETLFGDINPSGKLPISFPRSAGHLPVYYNHKPSARRGYLLDSPDPLYAFGFGLSYTTFDISDVRLDTDQIGVDGATSVTARVTNTGKRPGTEVVQMYVRDLVSSVTRPVRELKGFQRVSLEPGESRVVTLPITPDSLAFTGIDKTRVVEPGEFDILVGSSSRISDLTSCRLSVG